jgi:DDE superfamily endonuclease
VDDKYDNWSAKVPCAIVDTFSTSVQQPREESGRFLNSKGGTEGKFALKYEVVIAIGVPRVIWFSGPWLGQAADETITFVSRLKEAFVDGEVLLADKGYRGDFEKFIVPISGHRYALPTEQNARNYLIYSARQSVERAIKRLRQFGIFHVVWRYSFSFHYACARSAAKLTNLFLLFEPLG